MDKSNITITDVIRNPPTATGLNTTRVAGASAAGGTNGASPVAPSGPTSTLNDEEKRTLRLLVQHVARKFYDVDQVVVLDQLAKHDVLKDEDLAGRIGTNAKDTAKRLAKLMSARLVSR
ncbi:uncharacterized protein EI90DRAFT_1003806 [Cantharellus anzutake]|uniref:uncharacterized protein n=1 Tax=Cantharellus anzutake TaxID=1750568 RepID=UPI001904CE40|nr:uncharacterized protein EI90DRAFT_1003806 [Cantharellus anzutake]KAF8331292.1 hypothetical protein EI90DRAFT_1003806 [Cantharellus anzutake]